MVLRILDNVDELFVAELDRWSWLSNGEDGGISIENCLGLLLRTVKREILFVLCKRTKKKKTKDIKPKHARIP